MGFCLSAFPSPSLLPSFSPLSTLPLLLFLSSFFSLLLPLIIALAGLVAWVAPTISMQSANFARELPSYTQKARDRIVDLIVQYSRVAGGTAGRGKSASSGLVNFLLGTTPPRAPSPTPV